MAPREKRFSPGMGWTLTAALAALAACGPAPRPYFVRSAGGYVTPSPERTPTAAVPQELKLEAAEIEFGPSGGDDDEASLSKKKAARLRKIAESYLGVPYRFAGQSRAGMDCSGFLRQVFSEAYGMDLPHSSAGIGGLGRPVARRHLRVGDVVLF